MPKTVRKTDDLRKEIAGARKRRKTVGFVPTMGYLHAGHLALVDACRKECDVVVVSIFVNPKQFGPGEDLEHYPRDLRRDKRLLARHGCDLIFVPSAGEIYPSGFRTVVGVEGLRDKLCGPIRPGHFDGVCTVVLKLLLAVRPDAAYFGEKDYQQLVVIRRMIEDLGLGVDIRSVPTVRDKDGLALSSRNAYLSAEERSIATSLFRSLELAKLMIASGERRAQALRERITSLLVDAGVSKIEYVSIIDPATLDEVKYVQGTVRIALAVWVGRARLIDNIAVETHPSVRARRRPKRGAVCVILAAGEGKRMKSTRPKLLHPIGGKPMVEHVVATARQAGIKDIFAVVGHRSDRVEPLMKRLGVETVRQDVQRGTGHAVLQVYPVLSDFRGDMLVLTGDAPLIRASTLRHLLSAHEKHSNAITFGTAEVPDARGYGRVVRDNTGAFSQIIEEKDADSRIRAIKEINAGFYCFRAEPLFDALLMTTADNAQMEYYLPDAIRSVKSRGGRVEAVLIPDHTEALGINTAAELEAVRRIYSRRLKHEDNKRGMANGIHRKRR
jgi:pantoate--beta-alanine ligase